MPSIYSSAFHTFVRQGFSKTLTHGYAQSFVAVTHPHILNSHNRPSLARRDGNHIGRIGSLGLQTAVISFSQPPTAPSVDRRQKPPCNGSLENYCDGLLKKQVNEESEHALAQFQPKLEWKPTPDSILLDSEPRPHVVEERSTLPDADREADPDVGIEPPSNLAQDAALETHNAQDDVLAQADPLLTASGDAIIEDAVSGTQADSEVRSEPAPSTSPVDDAFSRAVTPVSSSAATSVTAADLQSQGYADQLSRLAETGQFADIPGIFETMLTDGVTPSILSYNALLRAAIHLPNKIHITSRALEVYADMLRRKILPDHNTYNTLVDLLASRSLEVADVKKQLEEKRMRFGGMDRPGSFIFASHELEYAILSEDDRLDLAIQLFDSSVASKAARYSPDTYHHLISACAQSGRIPDMIRIFEHMESGKITPAGITFPPMITAFAKSGNLVSAVECYGEYRNLAIANDKGNLGLPRRCDADVYAAVINAYVMTDKLDGAVLFYQKIIDEYGARAMDIKDAIVRQGFVKGFIERGVYHEALRWAQVVERSARAHTLSQVGTAAADHGDSLVATSVLAELPMSDHVSTPAMAMLALSVRQGNVASASKYWQMLSSSDLVVTPAFIEPTAMYAVAMIGSGHVSDGLAQSKMMFQRIREAGIDQHPQLADEIDEGVEFIRSFMSKKGIVDSRDGSPHRVVPPSTPLTPTPSHPMTPISVCSFEDAFDPYGHSTDFKGSMFISDALGGAQEGQTPRMFAALSRLRNMRRSGRHPRYITYAKLIFAAARHGRMDLCDDVLSMARRDVPLLSQYAVVRYGWSSIIDAMIGACLHLGHRDRAAKYHQELLNMGHHPSANTYGLYITTLKESKTSDEASEAVKIFHRARAEGVEPSSFLYNALIGKLGKARRIDDCLFYFGEMRQFSIKPTSVTYGTLVNALCRVSDEAFAEELFNEMEEMPNYKARPAPYNSMMQFFLTTKRDKAKVLAYFERMRSRGIAPTSHTYKLLVDTHASLEPVNMTAAGAVLDMIHASGQAPEPVHYASLIHARGCVLHDMAGARRVFDEVMEDPRIKPHACLYQALFESMVANHQVSDTPPLIEDMARQGVEMTAYIVNTLIHGWAAANDLAQASRIYDRLGFEHREPSTYEAMTRACLASEQRDQAKSVASEMLTRGYPSAVVNRVLELLGGSNSVEMASVAA